MTEEDAYDMGFADGYSRDEPGFKGDWPLFSAYHRGYEQGATNRDRDDSKERVDEEQRENQIRVLATRPTQSGELR